MSVALRTATSAVAMSTALLMTLLATAGSATAGAVSPKPVTPTDQIIGGDSTLKSRPLKDAEESDTRPKSNGHAGPASSPSIRRVDRCGSTTTTAARMARG